MTGFAALFPGQGSQSLGMMGELAREHGLIEDTFAQASERLGYDLWQLVQEGPKQRLDQTEYTQPAMLAAGVAAWRLWLQETGLRPRAVAGHSLGEYSALVCAEVLDFADAVDLVAVRARLMQGAVPQGSGAMAAILGLADDQVREVCRQAAHGEVLEAVNFNAPGQVVIAGTATAVARGIEQAKTDGAKRALALPVSVPSHCSLMKGAADALAERLAATRFRAPQIPVLQNATASSVADVAEMRALLQRQLYSPVLWVDTVLGIRRMNLYKVVEFGPGKVLSGLNKRIDKDLQSAMVLDLASLQNAREMVEHE